MMVLESGRGFARNVGQPWDAGCVRASRPPIGKTSAGKTGWMDGWMDIFFPPPLRIFSSGTRRNKEGFESPSGSFGGTNFLLALIL